MATTEQEMVVRAGRPETAAAEGRMKPARVLTALAEELDVRMEGSKVDVPGRDRRGRTGLDRRLPSEADRPDRELPRQTSCLLRRAGESAGGHDRRADPRRLRVLGSGHDLAHPVRLAAALPAQQDHREQRARPVAGGALHQPGDEHLQPHLRHHHPRRPRLQGAIRAGEPHRRDERAGLHVRRDVPLATAPSLTFFSIFIIAPDPGQNPRLVELNATADIVDIAQPFAAFATNHLDIDSDPGFLNVPPQPPQFQHDIPLRYLIYRK